MKNLFITILIIIFGISQHTNAQTSTVITGKVTYNGQILKNYKIHFQGHGDALTNSAGEFKFQLVENYSQNEIAFSVYDDKKIIEPIAAKIPVVTKPDYFHNIRLGSDEHARLIALVKRQMNQIEDKTRLQTAYILENIEAQNKDIADSILKLTNLRGELEYIINNEKKLYRIKVVVPTFDSVYDIYVSRLKDLRDAFNQYGPNVFYNPSYANYIQKRIDAYNEAYELLNAKKGYIINNVNLYWEDPIPFEIKDFIEYKTLQNFHNKTILTSNRSLINSINAFNNREKERRNKKEIRTDILEFVETLTTTISYLSDTQKQLSQKLRS